MGSGEGNQPSSLLGGLVGPVTLKPQGEVSNGWLETCEDLGERRAGAMWEG